MTNTLRVLCYNLFNSPPKINKSLFLIAISLLLSHNLANAQLPQFEDFELNWGIWNDGGADANRNTNTFLNGNWNLRLRDNSNSSNITSDLLDLTPYSSVTFDFLFYSESMEGGENFFIEYDDGSGFTIIANYRRGIEFNNNIAYSSSITLTSGVYAFNLNSRFRIRCDASDSDDLVFIDDINITGVLGNDDCASPISLTPNVECVYVTGTTLGATQSLTGCSGSADDDVWFSFTAINSEHTIEVDPITLNDAVFQVFDNCGGTSIACQDSTGAGSNEALTLTGLTIGNTYFIRVYSYFNGVNQQGEFDICITTPPPPPVNDDCVNAITLTSNEACLSTTGTTEFSTSSSPSGCSGTADDDVWFAFTAIIPEHVINVDPITLFDAVIEVFDNCGGTSIACRDATSGAQNEILTLTGLTPGNTYYIRIFSYFSNVSDAGTFDICITNECAPSNELGTSSLGCPFVELGGVGLGSVAPPPVECFVGETTIEANYLDLKSTTNYLVESIPYDPPFQFGCLENPVSVNQDDVWSPEINLPFNFCFYGNNYNSVVIGSNGVISFDADRLANGPTGWRTKRSIPNIVNANNGFNDYFFGPSIFGVHHDVDPSQGGEIGYQLITLNSGCQALVAAWSDVPMYFDNSRLYSGMIVFYENTNIIEVYVKEKNLDGTGANNFGTLPWNDGNASIGIQEDRFSGLAAPGRNTLDNDWTATNEAWRFTPNGASITELKWYENSISDANEIIDEDNDNQITVAPQETTTYTAQVTYTLCDGTTIVETNETIVTIEGKKTWNGSVDTSWDNPNNWTPVGVPIPTDCVTIPATGNDPIMSGATNAFGYNLEIVSGAKLTQQTNTTLTIEDDIVIQPNGDLEVRDSASVIQILDVDDNKNTGVAKVQRRVADLNNYDYVYWSSPVEDFNVRDVSPGTSSSGVYEWLPTTVNGTAGEHGSWVASSENMTQGKGYIVRGLIGNTIANTAEFSGKLNNGKISYSISRGNYRGSNYPGIGNIATEEDDNWNLLGNPYPSAIALRDFVQANSNIDGTLYFWQHLTPLNSGNDNPFFEGFQYNYSPNDYLAANSLGSTPPGFNGFIASGQGFFALMLDTAPTTSTVSYNNTMRGNYANDGFYRSANPTPEEKHRVWLDLVDENNIALSTLIGFTDGATDGVDRLFDGFLNSQSDTQFYSVLSNQRLTIQGKGLPFENSEIIPLGYKSAYTGNYTITINQLDGLFSNIDQGIYLEDTDLNIIHDLRASPYSFTTEQGVFNERFILRFNNETLSIKDENILNSLDIRTIYKTIAVTSEMSKIKTFELFDITGRLIHKNLNVEETMYNYSTVNLSTGPYIVTVSLANGSKVSKQLVI